MTPRSDHRRWLATLLLGLALGCAAGPDSSSVYEGARRRPRERFVFQGRILELRQGPDGIVATVRVERSLHGPLYRPEVDCLLGPGWWSPNLREGDAAVVRMRRRVSGTTQSYVTLPWPAGIDGADPSPEAASPPSSDPLWTAALIRALRTRELDADLRREFLYAGPAVEGALVGLLEDSDPVVRWKAARVLSWRPTEGAVAGLTALSGEEDVRRRLAAAAALRELRSEPARLALEGLLADVDPKVRALALEAVGRHRSRASVVPVVGRLDDADRRVRGEAIRALGRIGGGEAGRALRARLASAEPSGTERREVLDALGRTGVASAVEVYEAILSGDDSAAFRVAIESLGRLGRAGLPVLIGVLESEDPFLRWMAAETLRSRTRMRFGYRQDGPKDERRAAVKAWRAWWEREGRTSRAG